MAVLGKEHWDNNTGHDQNAVDQGLKRAITRGCFGLYYNVFKKASLAKDTEVDKEDNVLQMICSKAVQEHKHPKLSWTGAGKAVAHEMSHLLHKAAYRYIGLDEKATLKNRLN